MTIIYYKRGIRAARIAYELGITAMYPAEKNPKRIFVRRKQRMPKPINWGCGRSVMAKVTDASNVVNGDNYIAVSKVRTFRALADAKIQVPMFSTDWNEIALRGKYLARRDYLTGGEGIAVVEKGQAPPQGKFDFYSLVVSKAFEIRLHVWFGQIICEQFKFVPAGSKQLIRNHAAGATFSNKSLEHHLDSEVASQVREVAIKAVAAVGLFFGAVDLMIGRKGGIYVLEVNTAPGLTVRDEEQGRFDMPSTYEAYLGAFRSLREANIQ